MNSLRLLFIFPVLIASLSYAVVSTIHVPKDQPTIQAELTPQTAVNTVLVAPGTYKEKLRNPHYPR